MSQNDPYVDAGGWGHPLKSRKWHWFKDGYALCGKWAYFAESTDRGKASSDCCKACEKRLTLREGVARG